MLEIKQLTVGVERREPLHGVSLKRGVIVGVQ